MNFKSLFIKQSPEEEAAKTSAQAAPAQDEASEESTSRPAAVSSGRGGRNRAATRSSEESATVDQGFIDQLTAALEEGKPSGYSYFEFKESLSNMEKTITDEATRFVAAGAAAKAMKCTPSKLISTAQASLQILDEEESHLKSELEDAAEKDAEKERQLREVEKKIASLEQERTTLTETIESNKAKNESIKKSFAASKISLASAIEKDIKKIEQYLSK